MTGHTLVGIGSAIRNVHRLNRISLLAVPLEIEHTLIWTRVPILPPPHLIPSRIAENLPEDLRARVTKRLEQDGIWGFTGNVDPPPSPSLLPQYLGALSEWGITMDKLIRSSEGSVDEEAIITTAGDEIRTFIKQRWNEAEWETAWFVNPPVSLVLSASCRRRTTRC